MLVAWVFTELSGIALATATRFVFLDSVPCNWSSLTCATWRMTSQSWNEPERKMQPGMHSSHVSFIRVLGKIPTNTWHRWKTRRRKSCLYVIRYLMERRSITRPRIIWSNQILEEFLLLVIICNSSNILKIYSNHRRMKIKNFQTKTKKCRYLNYAGKFIVCPIYLFSNLFSTCFFCSTRISRFRESNLRDETTTACRFSDGWSPVVTRLNRNEMQRVGYARICPLLPRTRATFVYSRYALPICIDPSTCMQSNFIQRFEQRI